VIQLSDGRVLAESGHIVSYLVKHYGNGKLRPMDEEDRLNDDYFIHFAEGSLMPTLLVAFIFNMVEKRAPFFVRHIASGIRKTITDSFINPNTKRQYKFVEDFLSKHPFFGGNDLGGSDCMMSFPLEAATQRGFSNKTDHPSIFMWVDKIHARPAYKRALERGLKYNIVE